jgi:hypothetical protein
MASWREFQDAAPEFAESVRGAFAVDVHAVLATLRRDGSPRLSGMEPKFVGGQLWLGMMPDSVKVADLRRDGRFALHNASREADMGRGDAKLAGHAVEVVERADRDAYRAAMKAEKDWDPGEEFTLFRGEITEAVTIAVAGDELVITSWRPGQEVRRVARK